MESIQSSPRKRRSKEEIQALVSTYDQQPSMSIKAFCILHKIKESSFYSIRKRSMSPALSPASGFINIPIPVPSATTGTLFAEVGNIKLYQPVPADYLKSLIP